MAGTSGSVEVAALAVDINSRACVDLRLAIAWSVLTNEVTVGVILRRVVGVNAVWMVVMNMCVMCV